MKYIFAFFIVSLAIFTSCDGKDRAYKTNQEIIKDSNLSASFFEQINYIPEHYSEQIIDTILSNGFKISIKFFSDMNSNILNEFKIDTIQYKQYYREYKSELSIELKGKPIFNKTIDKSLFIKKDEIHFWKKSIMLTLYIDEEESSSDKLYFNTSFCIPESEICKDFRLVIDINGKMEIIELKIEELD